MRLLDAILNANRNTVDGHAALLSVSEFANGLPLVALTCIDARLNPRIPESLGVPESHFVWLRNAGNIITGPMSSTMRSLALACAVKGGKEILVLGHTDCLVRKTGTMELLGHFSALGVPRHQLPENLQEFFGLFASERQNVLKAVEHVRASPLIGPNVPVHGALLDLATGKLELLVNGYQSLATVNSAPSVMPGQSVEAKVQPAIPTPPSGMPGSLQLDELKLSNLKIGEPAAPFSAGQVELATVPADKPKPSPTAAQPPPVPVDAIPALKQLVDLAHHYRIVGGDGKHYGPVPATVLLRWIGDGRVDAETSVQVDGINTWVKLHQIGEVIARARGRRK